MSDGGDQLPPLDTEGILWIAALELVPAEDRTEWVRTTLARVEEVNAARAGGSAVTAPATRAYEIAAASAARFEGYTAETWAEIERAAADSGDWRQGWARGLLRIRPDTL